MHVRLRFQPNLDKMLQFISRLGSTAKISPDWRAVKLMAMTTIKS